jgi:two-component system, OmpR family, sensor histidine kinase KdpD
MLTTRARPAQSPLGVLLQLLLAAALVAVTTVALRLLGGQLNTPVAALLYLLPVVVSTTLGGLTIGILAAILAFLTFNYFFIPPYYTLFVHQPPDLLMLVVFLALAVMVSQLLGRAQSALEAARARERETTYLYELTTALTGLRAEADIARELAEQVRAFTGAEAVELDYQPGAPPVRTPPDVPVPSGRPPASLALPLKTARGQLGELRLWRAAPELSAAERQLLQTIAGQGALALEHNQLWRAETQARVLAESDRLKSALLSSVSHELRTPLATIKAAATSLRGGEVDWASPARADLLAAVEEEADHLNRLVGNLLDMSRLEAGVLKPHRQWLSLAEVVGGTLVRLRHATQTHTLAVDVPDELPLVPADHVQLDQVFTNLIENSLKYAPPGSTITLCAAAAPGWLQVRVQNQGPPVPNDHLPHIFDRFYRVQAADRVTGSGLGLPICKGIVEAHGGRIWAENLPEGLAFNFTLPLAWGDSRPPRVPPEDV